MTLGLSVSLLFCCLPARPCASPCRPHGQKGPRAARGPRGSACCLRQPSVLLVGISGRLYQAARSGKHFPSSVPVGHCPVRLPSSRTSPATLLLSLRTHRSRHAATRHRGEGLGGVAPHTGAARHAHGPHSRTRDAGRGAHATQRAPGPWRPRARAAPTQEVGRALPVRTPCPHHGVRSRRAATSRGRDEGPRCLSWSPRRELRRRPCR